MANQGGAGSGYSNWYAYRRASEILPPLSTAPKMFRGYRIPRPAVELVGEAPPGLICWGVTGSLPSPTPLPTLSVNIKWPDEHWGEVSRETERVRIENPDDKSQYIMDDRAKTIAFKVKQQGAKPGGNTATLPPPGVADYINTGAVESGPGYGPPGGPGYGPGERTTKLTYAPQPGTSTYVNAPTP